MMRFMKRNKIFSCLIFCTIFSMILALIFWAKLDQNSRNIVFQNIHLLLKGNFSSLENYIVDHFFLSFFAWVLGFSIIGMVLIFILYSLEVFLFTFHFCAFISTFGFAHIISIIIYFLPVFVFLLFFFLLVFYSLCFSSYLFRFLFRHQSYSFPSITKRYCKILFLFLLGFIISSIAFYFVQTMISPLFY